MRAIYNHQRARQVIVFDNRAASSISRGSHVCHIYLDACKIHAKTVSYCMWLKFKGIFIYTQEKASKESKK